MNKFDVIIIGGGLAGLATAAHLKEKRKNIQILVYDATEIGDNASGVPGGMVNPVTGQNAVILWEAKACMQMLEKRLEQLSGLSQIPLSLEKGVLRPAIDENLGKNLKLALNKYRWPKNWVQWVNFETANKLLPFLKDHTGGLHIKNGKVVRTPEYLDCYSKYLKAEGVKFQFGGPYKMYWDSGWILNNRIEKYSAPVVIVAAGYKSRENKFWGELPINSVKGQLAIYNCEKRVDSFPAVSAYGYIAPIDTHQLVVGSTYEHQFVDKKPDTEGADLLDQKLKELLPELYPKCKRIDQWSGIRATTPDRLPIIGKHPKEENMYIFTGLGSKGLLYSEFVASLLANHLISGSKIPENLSLYRFSRYRKLQEQAIDY